MIKTQPAIDEENISKPYSMNNNIATVESEIIDPAVFAGVFVEVCDSIIMLMPQATLDNHLLLSLNKRQLLAATASENPIAMLGYKTGLLGQMIDEIEFYHAILSHLNQVGHLFRSSISTAERCEERVLFSFWNYKKEKIEDLRFEVVHTIEANSIWIHLEHIVLMRFVLYRILQFLHIRQLTLGDLVRTKEQFDHQFNLQQESDNDNN